MPHFGPAPWHGIKHPIATAAVQARSLDTLVRPAAAQDSPSPADTLLRIEVSGEPEDYARALELIATEFHAGSGSLVTAGIQSSEMPMPLRLYGRKAIAGGRIFMKLQALAARLRAAPAADHELTLGELPYMLSHAPATPATGTELWARPHPLDQVATLTIDLPAERGASLALTRRLLSEIIARRGRLGLKTRVAVTQMSYRSPEQQRRRDPLVHECSAAVATE